MLINFSLENWMSFYNRTSFSMLAGSERIHGERIPYLKKYKARVLPIAAIYGANASGKTNFFKAFNFVKNLVIKGTLPESPIPVETFKLTTNAKDKPSSFSFEILAGDKNIYEFSFSATHKYIIDEKLVLINSKNEKILYHRQKEKIIFHESLKNDSHLNFVFDGTRENQLFLTNSISQKVNIFSPVYNWFQNSLELIAPDSRFGKFEHFFNEDNPLYSIMIEMLANLDTGITRLGGEDIPFENISIPEYIKNDLIKEIKDGMTIRLMNEISNDRYIISRKGDKIYSKKLYSYHNDINGKEKKFEIQQESDGTKRIIDLLPSFINLYTDNNQDKVYIIDEVDRSIHPLMIYNLLEKYLNKCSKKTMSQLLFTTHNIFLIDKKIFRSDEMWITERNQKGISNILSFFDYKDTKKDKDILRSYLNGRLGGIPVCIL